MKQGFRSKVLTALGILGFVLLIGPYFGVRLLGFSYDDQDLDEANQETPSRHVPEHHQVRREEPLPTDVDSEIKRAETAPTDRNKNLDEIEELLKK